jgi:hypothetical protein
LQSNEGYMKAHQWSENTGYRFPFAL